MQALRLVYKDDMPRGFQGAKSQVFLQGADLLNLDELPIRFKYMQIGVVVVVNAATRGAMAATFSLLTEHKTCQSQSHKTFTYAIDPAEQIRMCQFGVGKGMAQELFLLFMSDDVCECHGAIHFSQDAV
jgi:hypothetical protein